MKVKRRKAVKRILEFYLVNFGIKSPLKVIADGPYLRAACMFGKDLQYDLENYLGAPVKLFVTPGVLRELEMIGEPVKDVLALARTLDVAPTPAADDATAVDCILSVLADGNPQKFAVASNDKKFGLRVREIPGVPVLYFNRDVFVLDPPAPASQRRVAERNRERVAADIKLANEATAAVAAKRGVPQRPGGPAAQTPDEETGEEDEPSRKRHRHKPRGPNPLAMKKKKKKKNDPQTVAEAGQKAGSEKPAPGRGSDRSAGAVEEAEPAQGGKKRTRRGRRKKAAKPAE